jgi:hypothetical protein
VQRLRTTFEDGGSEIAVSAVDLLMNDTDAFIQQKRPCYGYNSSGLIGGNMNKAGMWESIIDELEETCVSKIERPESGGPHLETVYKVPVIGFKQFTASTEDEDYMLGAYRSYQADDQYDSFANLKKSAVKKIKRNPAKVWQPNSHGFYLALVLKQWGSCKYNRVSFFVHSSCSGRASTTTRASSTTSSPSAPTA